MSESLDVSQVLRLAADLGKGDAKLVTDARKILEVGAFKIKQGMQKDAEGIKHAPAFPASITYDVRGLSAEIGPDKNRTQGALGNILYFGTSDTAPRIPDVGRPLRAEAPVITALLAAAAVERMR